MTKRNSIVKNYLYNLSYQILAIILPIITLPYISRVLGSSGLGAYAFTFSIVQYAVLLGSLGIPIYGSRTIASVRDNKAKLQKTFWNIAYLNIFSCFLIWLIFLIFVLGFSEKYKYIFLIQSIYIFAVIFDISWFYIGLEDFKKTVTRSFIVKLVGAILIFSFIRESSQLWLYCLILGLSMLLGNISLWLHLRECNIKFLKPDFKAIRLIIIPSILLLTTQIATMIFTGIDKIMLGMVTNPSEIGNFDVSQKIPRMLIIIPVSLCLVLVPRLSNSFANNKIEEVKKYFLIALEFMLCITLPFTFGLMAVSDTFVPWFLGSGFEKTTVLLKISCFLILLDSINGLLSSQVISLKKDKIFNIGTLIGCFVNITVNIFLIPKFLSIGASIAYIITITAVNIYLISNLKEFMDFKKALPEFLKYLAGTALITPVIYFIGTFLGSSFITTIVQIFAATVIYISVLALLKSSMLFLVLSKLLNFLPKNNKIDKPLQLDNT